MRATWTGNRRRLVLVGSAVATALFAGACGGGDATSSPTGTAGAAGSGDLPPWEEPCTEEPRPEIPAPNLPLRPDGLRPVHTRQVDDLVQVLGETGRPIDEMVDEIQRRAEGLEMETVFFENEGLDAELTFSDGVSLHLVAMRKLCADRVEVRLNTQDDPAAEVP